MTKPELDAAAAELAAAPLIDGLLTCRRWLAGHLDGTHPRSLAELAGVARHLAGIAARMTGRRLPRRPVSEVIAAIDVALDALEDAPADHRRRITAGLALDADARDLAHRIARADAPGQHTTTLAAIGRYFAELNADDDAGAGDGR